MQEGSCEDDDVVAKLGEDIPSFEKKVTLDPFVHDQFYVPHGRQGHKLVRTIAKAINQHRPR